MSELPCEDWPPGYARDQRAVALRRVLTQDRTLRPPDVGRVFGLTLAEVSSFLILLQRDYLDKNSVPGMVAKCVDVHIHHLRRQLEPHGLAIETLWGEGYRISATDRQRATDMILRATRDG